MFGVCECEYEACFEPHVACYASYCSWKLFLLLMYWWWVEVCLERCWRTFLSFRQVLFDFHCQIEINGFEFNLNTFAVLTLFIEDSPETKHKHKHWKHKQQFSCQSLDNNRRKTGKWRCQTFVPFQCHHQKLFATQSQTWIHQQDSIRDWCTGSKCFRWIPEC